MKDRDFEKLAKRAVAESPDFVVKGPVAVMRPVKYVLRGLCFEGSSFDRKSFYVWMFFLPLFIPQKYLSFNFGARLLTPAGGDRWSADAESLVETLKSKIKNEVIPFLTGLESPAGIVRALMAFEKTGGPHARQAIAYGLARAGDVTRAIEELQRLVNSVEPTILWQREMAEQADTLKEKLLSHPAEAERQLEAWEAESAKNLGLDKFPQ